MTSIFQLLGQKKMKRKEVASVCFALQMKPKLNLPDLESLCSPVGFGYRIGNQSCMQAFTVKDIYFRN